MRALLGLGCVDEAHAFVNWLLHATRLTRPELRVLYDVYGNKPPAERELDLAGHQGSRPVRIGNLAAEQLQLDVYGEVIDAVTHFVRSGGTLDRETEGVLRAWGEYVCRHWDQPDEGIWEPRTGRAHHTHSRVLCWVALDRLLHLHEKDHLRWAPAAKFQENRDLIRQELERASLESLAPELRRRAGRRPDRRHAAAPVLVRLRARQGPIACARPTAGFASGSERATGSSIDTNGAARKGGRARLAR